MASGLDNVLGEIFPELAGKTGQTLKENFMGLTCESSDNHWKLTCNNEERHIFQININERSNKNFRLSQTFKKFHTDLGNGHYSLKSDMRLYFFAYTDDVTDPDTYPDYIFALELCDNVSINKRDNIQYTNTPYSYFNGLLAKKPRVTRVYIKTETNSAYLVAIYIGDPNSRDFTAFFDYLESSDNRVYNNYVHNMIQYIQVSSPNQQSPVTNMPHNLLVSGAPGTGKSHYLEDKVTKLLEDYLTANNVNKTDPDWQMKRDTIVEECSKRVTFYEDYTHEDFVGCYKPVPEPSKSNITFGSRSGTVEENRITYKFVAGPFTEIYINALKNPLSNYYLIIEEINRAEAASVFGELFQLMDRDANGVSDYTVVPESSLGDHLEAMGFGRTMRLPPNLYIWATMNSADQGVHVLDSAFKRRWAQKYMDISTPRDPAAELEIFFGGHLQTTKVLWDELRLKINERILESGFDEDRCLGPWYFKDNETDQINKFTQAILDGKNVEDMPDPLMDKLLIYLRQELFKMDPDRIFQSTGARNMSITDMRRMMKNGDPLDTILNCIK